MKANAVVLGAARFAALGVLLGPGVTFAVATGTSSASPISMAPCGQWTSTAALDEQFEVRLPSGSTWRAGRDAAVEVEFSENGVTQRLVGQFTKVDRRYVVLSTTVVGVPTEKVIFIADISEIRAAPAVDPVAGGARPGAAPGRGPDAENRPEGAVYGKKGVFVLPLEGGVGLEFRWQEIDEIGRHADQWGHGQIIVLRIKSPGGSVSEAEKISDTLAELKKRHRVVAWVEEAISGGAYVALHCEEIYFTSDGTMGAITQWNMGSGRAVSKPVQDAWAERCADVAERYGNHNRFPIRAMVASYYMASYDVHPETGVITWYPDTRGKHVLSGPSENLVLNASNAVHSGIAKAIANSHDDLAKALQLEEWHEISGHGREIARRWQRTVETASAEIQMLFNELNMAPSSGDPLTTARRTLAVVRSLISWWDRAPNVCMQFGIIPKEELQRRERDIMREISRLQQRNRGR